MLNCHPQIHAKLSEGRTYYGRALRTGSRDPAHHTERTEGRPPESDKTVVREIKEKSATFGKKSFIIL